jgi:hypothetical protein
MPHSLLYTTYKANYVEKYTDMGEDRCCSDCSRGALEDQSLVLNIAPMLSSGGTSALLSFVH